MILGYLGPEGTNSHMAALKFNVNYTKLLAFPSIDMIFQKVANEEIDMAVVPIENNIEGHVNPTIDCFISTNNVFIQKLLTFPIGNFLMTLSDTKIIKKIISHPQPFGQCREFLHKNYPSVETAVVSSTAEAAKIVAKSSKEEGLASISSEIAAEIYNLKIVNRDIQDLNTNSTNFVLISKNDTSVPITSNKMILAFSTLNKPGELYKILDIFSLWDINMTSIVSRPSRHEIGEYVFIADLDVTNDIDVKDALILVKRKTNFYKCLGCYEKL